MIKHVSRVTSVKLKESSNELVSDVNLMHFPHLNIS